MKENGLIFDMIIYTWASKPTGVLLYCKWLIAAMVACVTSD